MGTCLIVQYLYEFVIVPAVVVRSSRRHTRATSAYDMTRRDAVSMIDGMQPAAMEPATELCAAHPGVKAVAVCDR